MESALSTAVCSKRERIRDLLKEWAKVNLRCFPWREKPTPYSILIAEVLLRRTTASAVSKIFQIFMSQYPSIEKLAVADKTSLEQLLRRIGYNRQRASALIEMAKFIVNEYNGQIPNDKERLLNVPHVGNYTASAIISLGYGIPSAMVDSNVSRIIKRLFLCYISGLPFRVIQEVAEMLAPKGGNQMYNLALLDFGALICTYGIPRCTVCPLSSICDYYAKGNPRR